MKVTPKQHLKGGTAGVKKLFIPIAVVAIIIIISFFAKTSDIKPDANDSTSAVKQQVEAMYRSVISDKLKNRTVNWEKKYFTEDFYEWWERVNEYDRQHHQGEIGFIDYDIWLQAQDYTDNPTATVKEVSFRKDYNDNEYADVSVEIKNGTPEIVNLVMVEDNGIWKIDDMDGIKTKIKTYLATDN